MNLRPICHCVNRFPSNSNLWLCYHCGGELYPTNAPKKEPMANPMPQLNPIQGPDLSDRNLFLAALDNSRGHNQQLIAQVGLQWITTLLRKNADYGSSVFKEPVLCPGMPTTSAIDVRMSDKIARIQNLKTAKAEVADESVDDTYNDLGSYCLLRKVAVIIEKQNESK